MRLPAITKVENVNGFQIDWSRCSAPEGAVLKITYPLGYAETVIDLTKDSWFWKTGRRIKVCCQEEHFNNCVITVSSGEEVIDTRTYPGEQSFNYCYFFPTKDYEKVDITITGENNSLGSVIVQEDNYETEVYTTIPSKGTTIKYYSTVLYSGKAKVNARLTETLEETFYFDYKPAVARSVLSCDKENPIENRTNITYSWKNELFNKNAQTTDSWKFSHDIDLKLNPHLANSISVYGGIDNVVRDCNLTYGLITPFQISGQEEELVWSGQSKKPATPTEKTLDSTTTLTYKITCPEELFYAIAENYNTRKSWEPPEDSLCLKVIYSIESDYKIWNMSGFRDVKITDFKPFKKKKEKFIWDPHYKEPLEQSFCGEIRGNNTILYNLNARGGFIPLATGDTKISGIIIKNSYFIPASWFYFPFSGIGGFIGSHDNYTIDSYNEAFSKKDENENIISYPFAYNDEHREVNIYQCGLINCIFDPKSAYYNNYTAGCLVGNLRYAKGIFENLIIANNEFVDTEMALSYGGLIGTYQNYLSYKPSYSIWKETTQFDYDGVLSSTGTSSIHYSNVCVVNQNPARKGLRELHQYAHPGWDEYYSEEFSREGKYNPHPWSFNYESGEPYWESKELEPYTEHQSYCFDISEIFSSVYLTEYFTFFDSDNKRTIEERVFGEPKVKDLDWFKTTKGRDGLTSFYDFETTPFWTSSYYIKERVSDELTEATLTTEEEISSSIPEFKVNPNAVFYLRLPGETIYKPCKVYARNKDGEYVAAKDIYVKVNDEYKKSY